MARALFNLNTKCGKRFSFSKEKDVHSMRQHCPVCLLKVNQIGQLKQFCTVLCAMKFYFQFNSIYFVFDRSKGVVNPQDIEHVNI